MNISELETKIENLSSYNGKSKKVYARFMLFGEEITLEVKDVANGMNGEIVLATDDTCNCTWVGS